MKETSEYLYIVIDKEHLTTKANLYTKIILLKQANLDEYYQAVFNFGFA